MTNDEKKHFQSKFGQLTLEKAPENNFVWSGEVEVSSRKCFVKIPICIFTKEQYISRANA
jgi:hypothetical protein